MRHQDPRVWCLADSDDRICHFARREECKIFAHVFQAKSKNFRFFRLSQKNFRFFRLSQNDLEVANGHKNFAICNLSRNGKYGHQNPPNHTLADSDDRICHLRNPNRNPIHKYRFYEFGRPGSCQVVIRETQNRNPKSYI